MKATLHMMLILSCDVEKKDRHQLSLIIVLPSFLKLQTLNFSEDGLYQARVLQSIYFHYNLFFSGELKEGDEWERLDRISHNAFMLITGETAGFKFNNKA